LQRRVIIFEKLFFPELVSDFTPNAQRRIRLPSCKTNDPYAAILIMEFANNI